MARNPHASYESNDHQRMPVIPIVNNLTTTNPGYALDARQGKALNDTFKSTAMFEKLTITVTTSATGNANITQLNANRIVVCVRGTGAERFPLVLNVNCSLCLWDSC